MLDARVAVVTGASLGLGRVMANALLEAGYGVTAVARTPGALAAFAEEAARRGHHDRLLVERGDVTSAADAARILEHTFERFGRIDGLVNNAGANVSAKIAPRFYDVPVDQWRNVMDVNVNGPFIMTRTVAPHLVAQGWGRIVNHVTAPRTITLAGFTPYGPSKAALEAASVAWAAELEGTGVTVNTIFPGGPVLTRRVARTEVPDASMIVSAEVVAAPIVWLMSSAADNVTGRRFTARLWDSAASDLDNLAVAGARGGW